MALPGWQVCEAMHDRFEQSLMSRGLRHKREWRRVCERRAIGGGVEALGG
jgi:hypothetical protein